MNHPSPSTGGINNQPPSQAPPDQHPPNSPSTHPTPAPYSREGERARESQKMKPNPAAKVPSKTVPPDPCPSRAHPEHRSQRKQLEKKHSDAFEWMSWVALGLAGLAVEFDVERDVRRCEERRERRERRGREGREGSRGRGYHGDERGGRRGGECRRGR
ncbi:hypothetical protein B0H67DRAFT_252777 [Lasiosphaeris hirsuta]|uniref:Uncharacterized protein n=1 Tax=Lasiosphaeris hirsuta TaxID=260670 RepID=A0AA40AHB2_9PEZI|nr:hypothetical protein B0H67DRAFT_252777 [Lasiosphaeris hirsuta]